MGLLDVLNGMQNGPRGPSDPSAKSGGMSPITMAILGLLAYKAVKHLGGSQPGASPAAPAPAPAPQCSPVVVLATCSRAGLADCSRAVPPEA